MKKGPSKYQISRYVYSRSEKSDAYRAIWRYCRRIAEFVAENDKILLNGICLSDVSKLVEIDKKMFDYLGEASLKLKVYDRHRKIVSAIIKRYKYNP